MEGLCKAGLLYGACGDGGDGPEKKLLRTAWNMRLSTVKTLRHPHWDGHHERVITGLWLPAKRPPVLIPFCYGGDVLADSFLALSSPHRRIAALPHHHRSSCIFLFTYYS
jgi:hypothetical protein